MTPLKGIVRELTGLFFDDGWLAPAILGVVLVAAAVAALAPLAAGGVLVLGCLGVLFANWGVAKDWKETSRYEQKTPLEAQTMYDAVANDPNGVLSWIRTRW